MKERKNLIVLEFIKKSEYKFVNLEQMIGALMSGNRF